MNVVSKTVAGGAALLAIATLVATLVAIAPRVRDDEVQSGRSAASLHSTGQAQMRNTANEPARSTPRPTAANDSVSLRLRVERLLLPGTPRGRFLAFEVLARCAQTLDFDRHLKSLPAGAESTRVRDRYGDGSARIAAACGDLTARQLDLRVELAASAADDGVPGAASAWVEQGPYGDRSALTQRPDDPLIVEWVQQAIARVNAATKHSDTEAIGQFGMLCLNWEMDDVARVRLLVDAAQERRREDQIKSVFQ